MTKYGLIIVAIALTFGIVHAQNGQIGIENSLTPVTTEQGSNYSHMDYAVSVQQEINLGVPLVVGARVSYGTQEFDFGMQFIQSDESLNLDRVSITSWSLTAPVMLTRKLTNMLSLNAGLALKFSSITLDQAMVYEDASQGLIIDGQVIPGSELTSNMSRTVTTPSVTVLPMAELVLQFPWRMNLMLGAAWHPDVSATLASDSFSSETGFTAALPSITHTLGGFHLFSGFAFRF